MKRAVLLVCLALVGCGKGEMAVQHKFKPFRPTDLFADGAVNQAPPEGTVAYGAGDAHPPERPAMTRALLTRGQERFDIYCAPCHGRDGAGTGTVQQRGFPTPIPFTDTAMLSLTDATIFGAITNGYGVMYAFSSRIPAADRWAIVAYLRALQLSQHAQTETLPPQAHTALEAAP